MLSLSVLAVAAGLLAAAAPSPACAASGGSIDGVPYRHAIASHGSPALPPDFQSLPYVNPKAPKGETLNLSAVGTFDSLNPFIAKGTPAVGVNALVYESLMGRSLDEPFSLYGKIAAAVATPPDRSWVAFKLRPEARFSDGRPLTAADIAYSLKALRARGRPNHRFYYDKVVAIETPSDHEIVFRFADGDDRELPLIIGLMPILPADRDDKNFLASLEAPVGSGPYIVERVDFGARLVFRRNPDHWGKELPINRGLHNFDRIVYRYFRDSNIALEALKTEALDLIAIHSPNQWRDVLNLSGGRRERLIRDLIPIGRPSGMFGFVFNARKPIFADRRVRKALSRLLDRQWIAATFYDDAYRPIDGYFDNSELSSVGRPADDREKSLLAPVLDAIDDDILAGRPSMPADAGRRQRRILLRQAIQALDEAGYAVIDGVMTDRRSGRPFRFDILTVSPEQDRLSLAYARTLERIGVRVGVRRIDDTQFQSRLRNFDFDMILFSWSGSLSPGNEQYFRWSSQAADQPGSFNFPGVKSAAVDAALDAVVASHSRQDLIAAVRALDRLLLNGYYAAPLLFSPHARIARWDRIQRPERSPLRGPAVFSWWAAQP